MAFTHVFVVEGEEMCGNKHGLVEEAIDCESAYFDWVWEMSQPHCNHCDALGHTALSCPAPVW